MLRPATPTPSLNFAVVNHSELRIRTISGSRPPLWTTYWRRQEVRVNFTAKNNAVTFQVTFDAACLSFGGVTGPGAAGTASGGVATITGAAEQR